MKEQVIELSKYAVDRAIKEGFEEVAAIVNYSRRTMVKFANSEITVVQRWADFKIHLYLVRNQKILIVEGLGRNREDIDKLVVQAKDRIKFIEPTELYAPLPEPTGKPLTNLVDKILIEETDKAIEVVNALIDAGHNEGAEKLAGTLHTGYRIYALVTSKGAELAEDKSFIQVYARAFKGDISGHWAWASTRFNKNAIVEVGAKAGRYAAQDYQVVNVEPGRYQAVLSPLVFGNLIGYVARAASAFMAMLGLSMFMKIPPGNVIGSEKLIVIDDPHEVMLPEARGFDDEGVATFKKHIIDKGIFKTFLHNSKTASKMGAKTTGNAGWIMPTAWNLIVEPGDMNEEEMIREIRRGFFILNNWYTRYQNWVEGQFSTVTRDLLLYIENGEIKGLVKRLRIADTFPNLLKNIIGLSKTRYDIQWWEVRIPTRTPYILVDNVMFTKPEV